LGGILPKNRNVSLEKREEKGGGKEESPK